MAVGGFYVGKCRFWASVATISGSIYGGKCKKRRQGQRKIYTAKCRKRRNRCEDFTRRGVTNGDKDAKRHRHAPP